MKINRKNDLEYITFDNLEQTGLVKHCFTTRHGGGTGACFAEL